MSRWGKPNWLAWVGVRGEQAQAANSQEESNSNEGIARLLNEALMA